MFARMLNAIIITSALIIIPSFAFAHDTMRPHEHACAQKLPAYPDTIEEVAVVYEKLTKMYVICSNKADTLNIYAIGLSEENDSLKDGDQFKGKTCPAGCLTPRKENK